MTVARTGTVAWACAGALLAAAACDAPKPRAASVDQPPVALLEAPASARIGETVALDGSGSFDVDGELASAIVVFGDGAEPAFTLRAAHAWANAGTYTVELFVVDEAGQRGRARARVRVE